jgi:type IV secretion system protein VirD4
MPLVTELGLVLLMLAVAGGVLFYDDVSPIVGRLMRRPLIWRLTGGAVLFVVVFTPLASIIFLASTRLLGAFPHPFWQWWLYLYVYGGDPVVRHWLVVSGIPAAVIALAGAGSVFYRIRRVRAWSLRRNQPPLRAVPAPIRGTTDNFGHSRWMTLVEAQALWPGPDAAFGGIVVGEAYNPQEDSVARIPFDPHNPQTWGAGGKTPLLIDPCTAGPTHSLVIAGSGSFKTTGHAVPTLLTWTGSAVVLDPSTELAPMLEADHRQKGQRDFVLHPNTAHEIGFNALDWIDITAPMAETDVMSIVEWICGDTQIEDATAAFFKGRGKALVACLLAHMLWDPEPAPELKTLRTLRTLIVTPEDELRAILSAIRQSSPSKMARDLAGTLKGVVDETFSGIYTNADECTSWLSNRAFAGLVSGDASRAADIVNGKTTVFVALPLKALQSTPAAARTIIDGPLNAAYEADGAVIGRVLFLLDEVARLGPMSILETARDAGRKYRITLHLLYQSVGQITRQWGSEGLDAWYEAVSWRGYAAIKDIDTARELSATIGQYGVLGWSEGDNTGSHSKAFEAGSRSRSSSMTYQEISRPLMRPEEIMHDLRDDAMIVVPKQGRPLICGRAIYFRRPEFTSRVEANRFGPEERRKYG